MLTCPLCKKKLPEARRECPTCKADLALLADYHVDMDDSCARAHARTKAGELGEAIWAYLEVLEVDPDHPEARQQVGRVVRAVRQFDQTAFRRWRARMRRQARFRQFPGEPAGPVAWVKIVVAFLLLAVAVFVGYQWGAHVTRQESPPAPTTSP